MILYSRFDRESDHENKITGFENITIAMARITEHYLQGEQSICDVWAAYINSRNMTLPEASAFIRSSHVLKNTSAHLIYADTFRGLSTRSNIISPEKFDVSYNNVDIFGDMEWIAGVGQTINVSRAYTNPMNGQQSLAFLNKIRVADEESGEMKDALLLRIVPVSELEEKWVFPQTEFRNAEMSAVNSDGDYIIKGRNFKSSNFFEFYKSYNKVGNAGLQEIMDETRDSAGTFTMTDSKGTECVIAHAPDVQVRKAGAQVTNGTMTVDEAVAAFGTLE